MISRFIKASVCVIHLSLRFWRKTQSSALIILNIILNLIQWKYYEISSLWRDSVKYYLRAAYLIDWGDMAIAQFAVSLSETMNLLPIPPFTPNTSQIYFPLFQLLSKMFIRENHPLCQNTLYQWCGNFSSLRAVHRLAVEIWRKPFTVWLTYFIL